MARSHPGQLALFDEFAAPLAMSAAAVKQQVGVVAAEPEAAPQPANDLRVRREVDPGWGPDAVFFAVMASGKALGDIVAVADAQRAEFGLTGWSRPPSTLHVSVLGAGRAVDLGEEDMALLAAVGDAVSMPRFELGFAETMSFQTRAGPMPLVLCCEDGAAELAGLADMLGAGMRERGFILKSALNAAYHLTLAYDRVQVPRTPLPDPIRMPVRDFVLIRSHRGEGRYEVIKKWGLAN